MWAWLTMWRLTGLFEIIVLLTQACLHRKNRLHAILQIPSPMRLTVVLYTYHKPELSRICEVVYWTHTAYRIPHTAGDYNIFTSLF